jgi:hypothetical protein
MPSFREIEEGRAQLSFVNNEMPDTLILELQKTFSPHNDRLEALAIHVVFHSYAY